MNIPIWIDTLIKRTQYQRSFFNDLESRMDEANTNMRMSLAEGNTDQATYYAGMHEAYDQLKCQFKGYLMEVNQNVSLEKKGG